MISHNSPTEVTNHVAWSGIKICGLLDESPSLVMNVK